MAHPPDADPAAETASPALAGPGPVTSAEPVPGAEPATPLAPVREVQPAAAVTRPAPAAAVLGARLLARVEGSDQPVTMTEVVEAGLTALDPAVPPELRTIASRAVSELAAADPELTRLLGELQQGQPDLPATGGGA